MASRRRIRYEPDYSTHPGEVLEEYLEVLGMTKAELANRCGRPTKTISEIIHGKAAITPETALQLERVLGRPATLWQNLEANYRLALARQGETEDFAAHTAWARKFPVKAMLSQGCFDEPEDDVELVGKLLGFFGTGTVAGWDSSFGQLQVAYRRSPAFKAAPESVTAWLRLGELAAQDIDCEPFNRQRFKAMLTEDIRPLTAEPFPEVQEKLVELSASTGVAVAFVPELPGTHLSGVARWLSKDKALIQLSLRYKTSDHVWFTFFHEAGHLLLHGKKTIFIDEKGGDHSDLEEQANRFASDLLIPRAAFDRFVRKDDFSSAAVKRFAAAQDIAPGIVVGRLQHEGLLSYARHRDLKESLVWGE